MRLRHYIIGLGFVICIGFPLLNNFVSLLPDIKNEENRKLKSIKDISCDGIDSMLKSTEVALIDQLSIRNRLQKFYNQLNIFVFRSSPVSISAFIGKDGWYYLAGGELFSYSGTNVLKQDELYKLMDEFKRRKSTIEAKGAKMYIAIVPVKANVYPEYMPTHIIKSKHASIGMQVQEYLEKNNLPIIDIYSEMRKKKSMGELYFKTDNHWNDLGAFFAANKIYNCLNKDFPMVKELSLDEYKLQSKTIKGGNIAVMFNMKEEITEMYLSPIPRSGLKSVEVSEKKFKPLEGFPYPQEYELRRKTKNDSLPKMLLIRDSFGARILPYLSEQTCTTIAIYDNWKYGLNEEIINAEKPDVVVYLILESNIGNMLE